MMNVRKQIRNVIKSIPVTVAALQDLVDKNEVENYVFKVGS